MDLHAKKLKQAGTGSDPSKRVLASHTIGSVRAGLGVSGMMILPLSGLEYRLIWEMMSSLCCDLYTDLGFFL